MENNCIIYPGYEEFHSKVVFYRIPKNAGTSIYNHLKRANVMCIFEDEIANKNTKHYKDIKEKTHLKPDEFKDMIIGRNLANYFSFCVVRNPWDRVVSMFLYSKERRLYSKFGIKKDYTFDDYCSFLKQNKNDRSFLGFHDQHEWTVGFYPPQKILRFENLQEEFESMLKEINLVTATRNLPTINKTDHDHYTSYYNSETKKIISDVFEKDIDSFKYRFEDGINLENQETKITI